MSDSVPQRAAALLRITKGLLPLTLVLFNLWTRIELNYRRKALQAFALPLSYESYRGEILRVSPSYLLDISIYSYKTDLATVFTHR